MTYGDDDVEKLNISDESWRLLLEESIHASTAELEQRSNKPLVLQHLSTTFGNKPFMLHHAKRFQQDALHLA